MFFAGNFASSFTSGEFGRTGDPDVMAANGKAICEIGKMAFATAE